jgi:hypothetical protein
LQLSNSNVRRIENFNLSILLPSDFYLDDPNFSELNLLLDVCQHLITSGVNVLLVGRSSRSLGYVNGFIYIGSTHEEEISQLISSLIGFDEVIALDWEKHTQWKIAGELQNAHLSNELSESLQNIYRIIPGTGEKSSSLHTIMQGIKKLFAHYAKN